MHLDIRAGHKTDVASIKRDAYGCNLLDGKLPEKLCEGIYDVIQQNKFTNKVQQLCLHLLIHNKSQQEINKLLLIRKKTFFHKPNKKVVSLLYEKD